MRFRFGSGILSVVLVAVISILVLGTPVVAQTPAAGKGIASSAPSSSSNSKTAPGGASSAETASAAAKTVTPAAELPAANGDVHRDLSGTMKGKKVDESYIVGIADVLVINVWKEADFSGPVVVRPDGMITLPVIGDVHVADLTTKQVQDILTEKLKPVVTEPQVTVIVRDIKSRRVYLVGKVMRPGAVALTGRETLLQVLAEAGGPAQFSKPQKMYVLRTVGDHQKRIQFNYKKVLAGSEPDLDLIVGDVIVVP